MKDKKTNLPPHLTTDIPNGLEEREKLYQKYGDLLPKPFGYQILCRTYIPPEKTPGGIFISEDTRANAVYQNPIGLVLDMGPDCFKAEKFKQWTPERTPKIGDWVIMPRMEFVFNTFQGWQDENPLMREKIELRLVFDEKMLAGIEDPRCFSEFHILGR